MSVFLRTGPRTRALLRFLHRRARAVPSRRRPLDLSAGAKLFRRSAVVFTDTEDFTTRTARDGILHFLMLFGRFVEGATPVLARVQGTVVKVEGDSLMLRFDDPGTACRGVVALERHLRLVNAGLPANERLRFSYGVGFGDLLEIEGDLFGLEVNLASKLGEDLAGHGQILLTPAAVSGLDQQTLRRVVPYGTIRFGKRPIRVGRFLPPRH